jgi:hypothetical protein
MIECVILVFYKAQQLRELGRYRDLIVCVIMTGSNGLSIIGEIQVQPTHPNFITCPAAHDDATDECRSLLFFIDLCVLVCFGGWLLM